MIVNNDRRFNWKNAAIHLELQLFIDLGLITNLVEYHHIMHEWIFWSLNRKDNNETGTVCFELKIQKIEPDIIIDFFHKL